MTHDGIMEHYSNILSSLSLWVRDSNQAILANGRGCRVEVGLDRLRLVFTFGNTLILRLQGETDGDYLVIEGYTGDVRPEHCYTCDIYLREHPIAFNIGGPHSQGIGRRFKLREGHRPQQAVLRSSALRPSPITVAAPAPEVQLKPLGDRVNILYVEHTTHIGGAEKSTLRIIRELDRSVYEPSVLIPRIENRGALHDDFERLCPIHYLSNQDWAQGVLNYVNSHPEIDIVHIVNQAQIARAVASFRKDLRVVWTVYMELRHMTDWRRVFEAAGGRVQAWTTDSYANRSLYPFLNVVPVGCDPRIFKPGPKEPGSVAYVTRIGPLKGIDEYCEIARRLPAWTFHLALAVSPAETPLYRSLEDRIPKNLRLYMNLGEAEAAKLMGRSEYYLSTSKTESLSVSIIEAMMCGCVPVCTGVGDVPNVISHGLNGYIIEGNPVSYFIEHAGGFNPGLGLAARRQALERWDVRARVRALEHLYGRMGKSGGARAAYLVTYPPHSLSWWDGKRDNMHYALCRLSSEHSVVSLIPQDKVLKPHRCVINGLPVIIYQYNDLGQVKAFLDDYGPTILMFNMAESYLHRLLLDAYPGVYKTVYEYGDRLDWYYMKDFDRIFVQQGRRRKDVKNADPSRVVELPYGVDSTMFRPLPAQKRYNAVMIGDFRADIKRQSLLVEAWKHVPGRLLLLGHLGQAPPYGTYEAECRSLAQRLGVGDRITFMDYVPHNRLPHIINQCRVGVMTSLREAGSRAQLEMMSCGLSMVVMSDCEGTRYFLKGGEEGLVVPPHPEDIAAGINQLLSNTGATWGLRASNRIRMERDYDVMYEELRRMVEETRTEVTVITTSLNKGPYINDCCWSVDLQRRHAKVNHIIVDAGSMDQTMKVLQLWGDKVMVFENRGQSQTTSLNYAYEQMFRLYPNTEYVGWLNADDYYREDWLSESLKAMRRWGCDVTCGKYDLVDEAKNLKQGDVDPGADQIPDEVDLRQFVGRNTVCQPTVLMRKSALEYERGRYQYVWSPGYEYTQDLELWIRLLKDSFKIRRIRKSLACLRWYPGQLSNTHREQQQADLQRTQVMLQ